MLEPQQKNITKSKKWIDYSSQEENDHHDEEKPTQQHHHQKIKSHKEIINYQHKNLPPLSTSGQPVNKHQVEDKRDLLEELRRIKGNTVWVVLSIDDQKNAQHLNSTIQNLKTEKNPQIISIFPSRDQKNAWDLRIQFDLGQKWIVQGFDKKKLIKLSIRKKPQRKQPKYEEKDGDYRPVRQYAPQHTTSTRYEPKHMQYKEKETYKSPNRESPNTNQNGRKPLNNDPTYKPQEKKSTFSSKLQEYIEKNPLAEKIEQKVEEELKERKLQKKDKTKNQPTTSKIFSKNPYDAFNDSD